MRRGSPTDAEKGLKNGGKRGGDRVTADSPLDVWDRIYAVVKADDTWQEVTEDDFIRDPVESLKGLKDRGRVRVVDGDGQIVMMVWS